MKTTNFSTVCLNYYIQLPFKKRKQQYIYIYLTASVFTGNYTHGNVHIMLLLVEWL